MGKRYKKINKFAKNILKWPTYRRDLNSLADKEK